MKLDLNKPLQLKSKNKEAANAPKKVSVKKVPTKRNINFATVGQKPIDKKIAIPAIVVIIVLAVLFSKFFVVDRLYALYQAQSEVNQLQSQVDAGYASLDSFDELNSKYAHYTESGMTEGELGLVNRADVINLLNKKVRNKATITGYYISDNEVDVNLSSVTLSLANDIANDLEESDIVAVCSVETAKKAQDNTSNLYTATLVIQLQQGGEDDEN